MSELDWYEDRNLQILWHKLSGAAKDVLRCLCENGPTYDGNVPSKMGRDELLREGYAAKIVIKNIDWGYQAATYKGAHVYKAGKSLLRGGTA